MSAMARFIVSVDDQAIGALRRLKAAVRSGIASKKRVSKPVTRTGDRDPKLLSEALQDFLTSSGFDNRTQVAKVLSNWAELVGQEVADHVLPERFDDGKLVLRADSTAWATQMRLLQATVQRTLNEQLGADTVRDIQVLGPDAPSWKFGQRHVPGRGPRDTYG